MAKMKAEIKVIVKLSLWSAIKLRITGIKAVDSRFILKSI